LSISIYAPTQSLDIMNKLKIITIIVKKSVVSF